MNINRIICCFSGRAKILFLLVCFALLGSPDALAQSRQQNAPSPIVSSEISGTIKARDLGDSRLTTYYYAFKGDRGDIFLNVVAKNFQGDIDIFLVEGLEPKTKITIYADSDQIETGRVIYLRKPENLLMRIQGRTPNDDAATYQIKFAGSFQPLAGIAQNEVEQPVVENTGEGAVKVNSVGTILEPPVSEAETIDAESKSSKTQAPEKQDGTKAIPGIFDPTKTTEARIREALKTEIPKLIITDPLKVASEAKVEESAEPKTPDVTVEITDKSPKRSALVTIERIPDEDEEGEVAETPEEPVSDPDRKPTDLELRRIKLVLVLKNGKRIERRMNRISSVNVFDGVLKVVGTDGKVEKFSILDIVKMTVE